VLAVNHERGHGRGSGVPFDRRVAVLLTVRTSKVSRLQYFRTREEALEAAGLSEQAMSQENVEIVKRCIEAYQAGDLTASVVDFDPEVEFDMTFRPEGGIFRGHKGVAEGLRTRTGAFEGWSFEVEDVIDAGDQVLVISRESGRGKGSAPDQGLSHVIRGWWNSPNLPCGNDPPTPPTARRVGATRPSSGAQRGQREDRAASRGDREGDAIRLQADVRGAGVAPCVAPSTRRET
jgi:ketosteroid isomerase-like protein